MSTEPLKVSLYGADLRMQKMLQMFLSGPGKGLAEIVPSDQAEADIVDLVGVSATQVWERYRKDSQRYAIVLSVDEVSLPKVVWVPKPIQKTELVRALRTLKKCCRDSAMEAARVPAVTLPRESPMSSVQSRPSSPQEYSAAAGKALVDYENEYLCGDYTDAIYLDPSYYRRLFYNPGASLQHWLEQAIRFGEETGKPIVIRGLPQDMVILSSGKNVFTQLSRSELHELCRKPLPGDGMRMQALAEDVMVNDADRRLKRSEAVLWEVALLCARGRVPQGTNLDQSFTLRQWPNLTRLALTPHAMQLAALWSTQTISLRESATLLGIRYRYVFSFYSACAAHDLISRRLFGEETSTVRSPSKASRFTPGFLRRMLEYLVGGSK